MPRIGAAIGPLSELRRSGRGATGLGRLGAVAYRRGARDTAEPLGLTCAHVLGGQSACVGETVFQPRREGVEPVFRADRLHPIGVISDLGANGPHPFAYPGEETRAYHVDCGAIRLYRPPACAAAARAARAHPLDIARPRTLRVRLLGLHARPAGRVVDIAAHVSRPDGRICENTIVIESLPGGTALAGPGASGALVVDELDRAIGLLWGYDLSRPDRAFACHLLPALDCLGLVMPRSRAIKARGMP